MTTQSSALTRSNPETVLDMKEIPSSLELIGFSLFHHVDRAESVVAVMVDYHIYVCDIAHPQQKYVIIGTNEFYMCGSGYCSSTSGGLEIRSIFRMPPLHYTPCQRVFIDFVAPDVSSDFSSMRGTPLLLDHKEAKAKASPKQSLELSLEPADTGCSFLKRHVVLYARSSSDFSQTRFPFLLVDINGADDYYPTGYAKLMSVPLVEFKHCQGRASSVPILYFVSPASLASSFADTETTRLASSSSADRSLVLGICNQRSCRWLENWDDPFQDEKEESGYKPDSGTLAVLAITPIDHRRVFLMGERFRHPRFEGCALPQTIFLFGPSGIGKTYLTSLPLRRPLQIYETDATMLALTTSDIQAKPIDIVVVGNRYLQHQANYRKLCLDLIQAGHEVMRYRLFDGIAQVLYNNDISPFTIPLPLWTIVQSYLY